MTKLEQRVNVLGVGVSATSMPEAVCRLIEARKNGKCGYVCVTGAHGVMESQRDETLRLIHNRSLMTVPDGMPTVWMGHEYGFSKMRRVYGPDLMLALCDATSDHKSDGSISDSQLSVLESSYLYPSQDETGGLDLGVGEDSQQLTAEGECFTHFLYGATEETLCKLKANLELWFPGIQIAGSFAPPFRPLSDDEESQLRQVVAECQPDFFWVGLSTPKQEKFMSTHAKGAQYDLDCGIMLGVGAAFDIHAGNIKDTPKWIQNAGLQWLHRLCKEPRRLWRRYVWIVPGFLWLAFLQLMGLKRFVLAEDIEP